MLNRNIAAGSVCGSNENNPYFFLYKELFNHIENMNSDGNLLGGDWNLVMNPEADYSNYCKINIRNARKIFLKQRQVFELFDVRLKKQPYIRSYS